MGENEYKDVCFPTTKEFHEQLQAAVLAEYQHKLEMLEDQEQEQEVEQDSDPGSEGDQDQVQEDEHEFTEAEQTPENIEGMRMNMT